MMGWADPGFMLVYVLSVQERKRESVCGPSKEGSIAANLSMWDIKFMLQLNILESGFSLETINEPHFLSLLSQPCLVCMLKFQHNLQV